MDRSAQACNTKKPWTVEEDDTLRMLVLAHGTANWTAIGSLLTDRTGKQCRERWHNHINPDIKKGEWTEQEDRLILTMQRSMGNQWAKITKYLPGRSDNAVKNRFHAIIRARSSQVPLEQVCPVPTIPLGQPVANAVKLEKWGSSADGVIDHKLQASNSDSSVTGGYSIPVITDSIQFGFQALQSLSAPMFGGSWAPASSLQAVNQVPASSTPQVISAPHYSGFASLSQECLNAFSSGSGLPTGASPAPTLKSLSPMTVDEEFLELWMSGSRDEMDTSAAAMFSDNVSECSDAEDFHSMLVDGDDTMLMAAYPVDNSQAYFNYQHQFKTFQQPVSRHNDELFFGF